MMMASERVRNSLTKVLQYCSVNLTKLMNAESRTSVRSRSGLNTSLALKSSTLAALANRVLEKSIERRKTSGEGDKPTDGRAINY